MATVREGGCLCGAVRFRAHGEPRRVNHCHCRHCRRASGAAFMTWAEYPADRVELTAGSPALYAESERVTRGFCGSCGTALQYARPDDPDTLDLALAAFDDPESLHPEDHLWTVRELSWARLADGLPRHARGRGTPDAEDAAPRPEIPIGGGFVLRGFRRGDAEALVKYADNRKIWLNVRDRFPYPYTLENAHEWLAGLAHRGTETVFAIANEEELVGTIGLEVQPDVYRVSAEIGYWVAEPFWGQGIATRAVAALTRHAFEELGLQRVYASHYEWNPASGRVLEKAGYVREGRLRKAVVKDGRLIDVILYAATRE